MTVEQIHELRKSFVQLESQADIGTLIFFRRFLELAPELGRDLHREIQSQENVLFSTLSNIIGCLELDGVTPSSESIRQELKDACGTAFLNRLTPEQWDAAEKAWIETLTAMLRQDFTPRLKEAWISFCQEIKTSLGSNPSRHGPVPGRGPGLTPETRES